MEKGRTGLRSFIDIRKGELEPALLFFSFWFLDIVVFQALRPLKKGLFVEHGEGFAGEGERRLRGRASRGSVEVPAAIAMIMFLYKINSQILDYQYSSAAESLEGAGGTQAFFGQIGTIVGAISVFTQLVLVSFLIRKLGITTALFVLPIDGGGERHLLRDAHADDGGAAEDLGQLLQLLDQPDGAREAL